MNPEEPPQPLSPEEERVNGSEQVDREVAAESLRERTEEGAETQVEESPAIAERLETVREHLHLTHDSGGELPRIYEKERMRNIERNKASSAYDKRLSALAEQNEAVRYALNRLGALGVAVGLLTTFFVNGTGLSAVLATGLVVVVAGWGIGRFINAIQTRVAENREHKRWSTEIQDIEEKFKKMPDRGY
jgi:F0F1-type ATP synthase membrane subunit c/vacuolar-type H+-ATPase subunit K